MMPESSQDPQNVSESISPVVDADENDPWVVVAKILRPHGLRGTFRLKPQTREVTDLVECEIDKFHVRQNGKIVKTLTRASARIQKDLVCMKFEEVADRTSAEAFINAELVISEEDRWDLPEGEYYIDDLAGMELLNEEGAKIGSIISGTTGTVHDFLEITVDEFDGKQALLPLIPEFVIEVNSAKRTVSVDLPDGLFD